MDSNDSTGSSTSVLLRSGTDVPGVVPGGVVDPLRFNGGNPESQDGKDT